MDPFQMVVAIVIVVTVGKVLQARYRSDRVPTEQRDDSVEAEQLRHDIRALRERIQVLERVITDNHGSTELDREIERLRDKNRV